MTENTADKDARKEAMKALRKARKKHIAAASARMKEHNKAIKEIKAIITGDGATVPAIVEQTNMPSAQVFWYLATLKKYGEILEGDKDGGYFRYKLSAETPVQEES
ncbi:MAG: hypothetical protein WAL98_15515 [Desulfatiglandaceae bacterium]